MDIILASNSPRRREILLRLGFGFRVEPSRFEETASGLSAAETVQAFARGKAAEVFSRFPRSAVLGADTVVELGGRVLGKPEDGRAAREMLENLSEKCHLVHTGVAVFAPAFFREEHVVTRVWFRKLSEETLKSYLESGLWEGKAGAYGIQDGFPLVEKIEGSYTNVMGLPEEETRALLAEAMR